MRTTSGRRRVTASTTWEPSSHSPTTVTPSSSDRISDSVARTIGWSSTTSTRRSAVARRCPHEQLGPVTWSSNLLVTGSSHVAAGEVQVYRAVVPGGWSPAGGGDGRVGLYAGFCPRVPHGL